MHSEREFSALLREELEAVGVFPTRETYERHRPAVTRAGETERIRVQRTVGRSWDDLLASLTLDRAEDDCTRVLGFGQLLTAFLVHPIDLPDEQRTEVASLGATANFLVATYDRLLERDNDPDDILSPHTLSLARAGQSVRLRAAVLRSRPEKRAFIRLVRDYFSRVESLTYAQSRHSVQRELVHRIREMYDAERRTVTVPVSAETLRIKNSYPFVVMGLPAWLATPYFTDDRYDRHMSWLERVGEFFGYVDDAVDLREDAAEGLTNTVALKRSEFGDERTAREIAEVGASVFRTWDTLTAESNADSDLDAVVRTCVASWFGGV